MSTLPAHPTAHQAATHLAFAGFPIAIERGVLALAIVSAALWLWQKVSERGTEARPPKAAPDYAGHFQLSEAQLGHCRAAQVCVVHHDAEGQIVAIRTVPTLPPTFTAPIAPVETRECEPEFAEAA